MANSHVPNDQCQNEKWVEPILSRPEHISRLLPVKKLQHTNSLEVIPGVENGLVARPGSADSKLCNPAKSVASSRVLSAGHSRRTVTPTKQIPLQAVPRKQESDDVEFEDLDYNWQNKPSSDKQTAVLSDNMVEPNILQKSQILGESAQDEDSSSESSTEEEKTKAPNELLMEFVSCLMESDYTNAKKLCTMILMYEPENAEALKFQPLIDEKLQLEEELAAEESGSEEEGSTEDEDDDSDEDDDEKEEDSNSNSSSSSSNEEEDDNDAAQQINNGTKTVSHHCH